MAGLELGRNGAGWGKGACSSLDTLVSWLVCDHKGLQKQPPIANQMAELEARAIGGRVVIGGCARSGGRGLMIDNPRLKGWIGPSGGF